MILAAEEHRQNANYLPAVIDVEPAHCPSDVEMPKPGQTFVMAFAAVGGGQDPVRGRADLFNPRLSAIEGALQAFAKAEIAPKEMVEHEPEVAFGIDRELKTEGRGRGVCQRPFRRAARPSHPH